MTLTNQGLQNLEAFAEEKHNAEVMLMCQILREIREIKELLNKSEDPSNGCDNSTCSADDSENEHH